MVIRRRLGDDGIMNNAMNNPVPPSPVAPAAILERPTGDRVIAGVASGLANRLDVGVGWVRIGFVLASFFGGLGFLLYAIGWLGIREEGADLSIAEEAVDGLEGASTWVGVGLMLLAAMIALSWLDIIRGELIFAAVVFVGGLVLYRGSLPGSGGASSSSSVATGDRGPGDDGPGPDDDGGPSGSPIGTSSDPHGTSDASITAALAHPTPTSTVTRVDMPPEPDDTSQTWGFAGDDDPISDEVMSAAATDYGGVPPVTPVAPVPAAKKRRRTRERSNLGRLTLASMLVVLGILAFLDTIDVVQIGFRHVMATILLVAGAGLIVGSLYGRARGLIVLGIAVTPLLIVATALPLSGEIGELVHEPVAVSELEAVYEIGIGELVVDLSRLEPLTADTALSVDAGIGHVVIELPSDMAVVVNAEVGIGEIVTPTEEPDGLGVDATYEVGADGPTLTLEVDLGIGQVEVIQR